MSRRFHSSGPHRGAARGRHDYVAPRPHTIADTQSTANTEPGLLPDADVTEGLSPDPLQVFSVPALASDDELRSETPIRVGNLKYIGSYNWLDDPNPTIVVPGSPRIWRDRALPFRVPFDEGFQIFDPNGYHVGSSAASPLIPLLRAVDAVAEENADTTMDWSAVDFVADRSSLRKLLRWIRVAETAAKHEGTSANPDSNSDPIRSSANNTNSTPNYRPSKGSPQTFRIDLQLGGSKTVLMQRWDTRTCQYITPPNYGCRVNFEKAATMPTPGCPLSSDYNRIVQYDLEGLQMVVRFEVDAHIFTAANHRADSDTAKYPADPDTAKDELPNLLERLSLNTPGTASASRLPSRPLIPSLPDSDSVVTIVHGGIQIPQSSIIEITTRSVNGLQNHKWEETYTQLFLSQTPNHFLAIHQHGTFEHVTKRALNSPEFADIARREHMQRQLRLLVRLLHEIQRLTREHGRRGRLSLVGRKGRLELYGRNSENDTGCLPDSELARFGF